MLSRTSMTTALCLWRSMSVKNFHCTTAVLCDKGSTPAFDVRMLEVLACPLSKKPLKYDPEKQELVCEELQVAYPIVDGIPNMIPNDARMLKKKESED